MLTISTSLERTLDINSANASKAPRNAFILAFGLLELIEKDFLIARI